MKCAILAGTAAMTIAAGTLAEAAQNSDNRGTVRGWSSSGWGSSGYESAASTPRIAQKSTPATSTSVNPANGGTPVPEPSNLLMLGLGVVGLIAGRMVALRRKKN